MDVVALCSELIKIDSINPFRYAFDDDGNPLFEGNESSIFAFCERYLRGGGFSVQFQDCGNGRKNLIAEKGEGDISYLLYAHVDTVEVKEGWTKEEALTPVLQKQYVDGSEEEVLVGLGSNDMKGGIAIILKAASEFQPQNFKLKVILGCDEEFYSLGSSKLVSESDWLDDVAGIIVPEIGEALNEPKPNSLLITLGRCGRAEFEILVPGTGGHGAEPDKKVNAITQASKLAVAIEELSRMKTSYRPFEDSLQEVKGACLVTRIEGGDGVLSVPDSCKLFVNFVLTPQETEARAKAELEQLVASLLSEEVIYPVVHGEEVFLPEVRARYRPTPPLASYVMEPNEIFVSRVLEVAKRSHDVQLGIGVSVADENRFGAEAKKPVVVIGPRGEKSHAAYEWVTTRSLKELEVLYGEILKELDLNQL